MHALSLALSAVRGGTAAAPATTDNVHILGDSFATSTLAGDVDALLTDTARDVTSDGVGGSSLADQKTRFDATPEFYGEILVIMDGGLSDDTAPAIAAIQGIGAHVVGDRWVYAEGSPQASFTPANTVVYNAELRDIRTAIGAEHYAPWVGWAQAAVGGRSTPYTPPDTYNWDPETQFPNFKAAYAGLASSGRCAVAWAGDSITAGVGAAAADYVKLSSVAQAAAKLATLGIPAHAYSHAMNHNNPDSDGRWTLGGSAHWSGAAAFGGPMCELGANDTLTFTLGPAMTFDRVKIVVADVGSAVCDVAVDGGSYTGSPFTGSNAGTGQHTFNVASGSHTSVTVKGVSGGTTYLQAIELWDTATGRVECINGGAGGYSSDALDGDGTGWGYLAGLLKTGASLAFFAFGVNDGVYAGRSKATYKASILNGVQRCKAAGMDVVLVAAPPINDSGFDSTYRADYLAALKEIADAENVPVWDQYATFAPWSGLDSADNLHFHSPFYGQQADVFAAIVQAAGADDRADIRNDFTPRSLREDDIHPTDPLKAIIAERLVAKLVDNGWVGAAVLPTYNAFAQAYFDEAGAFAPSTAMKVLVNAAVRDLIDARIWAKMDAIYFLNAETSNVAMINLVDPGGAYDLGATNSPIFTAKAGFTGNGANTFLNTHFDPSTGGMFTQDSASMWAWSLKAAGDVAPVMGNASSGGGQSYLYPRYIDDTAYLKLNGGTDIAPASLDGSGLFLMNRTAFDATQAYRNGAAFGSESAGASAAPPSSVITILGALGGYFEGAVAFAGFGCALSAQENADLYTILAALKAGVDALP